jgi:hypothetical protein
MDPGNDDYLGPALSDKILSDENPRDIQTSLNDAAAAATNSFLEV